MKSIKWIFGNILFLISLFLLAFIPLYPKLPVIGVEHTWVYIRLEDFLVAISVFALLVYLIKKRLIPKTPLTIPILLFWIVGAVSTFSAIYFIFPHIPNVFPSVALFSLARRVEYILLFFIGYFAIKNKKQVPAVVAILAVTVVAVVLYGLGQKFLGFPAYLTMNEEFAKGIPLKLSPLSRVPSTFAGHYDLAAYLVLVIPILGSMVFGFKKLYLKLILTIIALSGLILLFMTASRVSFLMYLAAISFMLVIQKQKKYIIPVVIISILLMNSFQGISKRFASTISQVDLVVDARTGKPVGIAKATNNQRVVIEDKQSTGENLPQGTGFINLPSGNVSNTANQVVYKRIKLKAGAETTDITTTEGDYVIKKALAYDVSFTTRFQGEWPRAAEAFKRNPLLGSGYSSINLATDNNYLRIFGEVGILGFISFMSIFLIYGIYVKSLLPNVDSKLIKSLVMGISAGVFGVALNASLIDVFEASKVAFVLWMLIGLSVGLLHLYQNKPIKYLEEIKRLIFSTPAVAAYFVFLIYAVYAMIVNNYFVGDDFVWLKWAANCKKIFHSGIGSCQPTMNTLVEYFTNSNGFFYRPGTKTYFYFMYGFFWLVPFAYHIFSITIHAINSVLVFLIVRKIFNKLFAVITTLFFVVLAASSESIFWISVTGHLISAMFILLGLVFYIYGSEQQNKRYLVISFLSSAIAPFFHEMGIIAPILIIFYGLVRADKISYKNIYKKIVYLVYLIPVPVYLLIRLNANSHWFNGDYNYNLAKLPFNVLGNIFGYLGLSLIGPKWMLYYEQIRVLGRTNTLGVSAIIFIFIIFLIFTYKSRIVKISLKDRKIFLSGLAIFIISLLPFLGLGNIALRYSYLGSIGVMILLVFVISKIFYKIKKNNVFFAAALVIIFTATYFTYNIFELKRINNDWKEAGRNTNKLLVGFNEEIAKKKTATNNPVFYFVNPPIKKGDAWVFPVGLPDALWFTFQNEYLTVRTVNSLNLAFSYAEGSTSARVFDFDKDGNVEEIIKTKADELNIK